MDSCYTQMTSLPVEIPELHDFLDGLYLNDAKMAKLVALLDEINLRSSTNAVRYCTHVITQKKVAEAAQEHYERILAFASMMERQHREDAYLELYARLRKQCKAMCRRVYLRNVRLFMNVVELQVQMLAKLNKDRSAA